MSTFDAATLRAQPDQFGKGIRGYQPKEVRAWLGRLALVAETLQHNPGAASTELPKWAEPDRISQQSFPVGWRGYRRSQVDQFRSQVAADFASAIESP